MSELALSQWGIWDDELDPVTGLVLVRSYMRRKHWEARMIAHEILRGMSGESDEVEHYQGPRQSRGADGKAYTWQDDPIAFLNTAQGLQNRA